ncbi:MAG: 50S ribosomal protein L10 [Deltaproteobacteria bacterium]|nr:50S ribosomal protein L10 [Deltaproteobacteria bacterium]
MNRTEKTELAKTLKEKFLKSKVAFFADYKGLTAPQADDLRKQLRGQEAEVKVLKNNLGRLIAKENSLGLDAKNIMNDLVGPTLIAFGYGDPARAAKVVHKFSQDNEAFKLKESLMGQKRISPDEIEQLAKLPSREVLLAKMLGSLNAPVTNFVGVLTAVPRSFVLVLAAIGRKKTNPQV